jgi:hypothetical protein
MFANSFNNFKIARLKATRLQTDSANYPGSGSATLYPVTGMWISVPVFYFQHNGLLQQYLDLPATCAKIGQVPYSWPQFIQATLFIALLKFACTKFCSLEFFRLVYLRRKF